MSIPVQNDAEITALLIAPDRDLAQQFLATLPQTRALSDSGGSEELSAAADAGDPGAAAEAHVVLLDLASDLAAAVELIRFIAGTEPAGARGRTAHAQRFAGDSAIAARRRDRVSVRALRSVHAAGRHRAAAPLVRARKLRSATEAGHVGRLFERQAGLGRFHDRHADRFSLQRLTGKRILLADCDLTGGTIGFYLKLSHNYSLVDALQHVEHLEPALWNSLAVNYGGVDILPAPAAPYAEPVDGGRLRVLIEQARQLYDWVILDLPTVFSPTSLMALAGMRAGVSGLHGGAAQPAPDPQGPDHGRPAGFSEGPLSHAGEPRGAARRDRHRRIMEKLFGCPVHASLPNDYFSLHRVVTLGQPLGPEGELGKAIERRRAAAVRRVDDGKKPAPACARLKPALSHA